MCADVEMAGLTCHCSDVMMASCDVDTSTRSLAALLLCAVLAVWAEGLLPGVKRQLPYHIKPFEFAREFYCRTADAWREVGIVGTHST